MTQPTVEYIAYLLYRELEGNLSDGESMALQDWRAENPEHDAFAAALMDEEHVTAIMKRHHPDSKEAVRASILKKMEGRLSFRVVPLYRRSFFRVAVAACIAAMIIAGGYLLFFKDTQTENPPVAMTNDIPAPQADKAVILLADGQVISVDSLTSYQQGGVKVTRLEDGRLVYTGLGTAVQFHTLTNPRGSKVIDMTLNDGTRVWLNAGSSVTYPVAFMGSERKVSITGEAYFEVAKDKTKPFTVSKGEMNIQVLGTKFNVNAYDDERDIKVTLLEGSVKVGLTPELRSLPMGVSKGEGAVLKPGEQAQVREKVKVVNDIDLDEVMAWKEGRFLFGEKTDIKTIMRQVARWYDVEVQYRGTVSLHFGGSMSRQENISKLLEKLEMTGSVHFKMEDRKVIVMP